MRIGYLGPEGTFSEEAARSDPLSAGGELVPWPTVRAVVMAVQEGGVDRAVVPIENSLEGTIGVTLDTLSSDATGVAIVGETVLAVTQSLIAREGTELRAIERVLSHPQGLAQCARFLRENVPGAEVVAATSTAEAVRSVAAAEAPWAAVGTRRAAELYGAVVLADGVEDEPGNMTRFVWLAPEGSVPAPDREVTTRTSLTFWGEGDGSPGWLVRCLSEFAFRGVNLTRIESRPLHGRLGHYRFFVDCVGHAGDGPVPDAVEALRGHCEEVRVLGSYPAAT